MDSDNSMLENFPRLNFIIFDDKSFKQKQQQPQAKSQKKFWSEVENLQLSQLIEQWGYKPTKIAQFIKTRDVKQVISHVQKINQRFDQQLQVQNIQVDNQQVTIQKIYEALKKSRFGSGIKAHYICSRFNIDIQFILNCIKF